MKTAFVILAALCIRGFASGKPIRIKTDSNLDFGIAVQGDSAQIVAPGSSENAQNASFEVKGEKDTAYTIVLPTSISLDDGSGHTIIVNNFQSNPPAGPNGLLSNNGKQDLYVGATRAALSPTQFRGTYTGSFIVTVVY